MRGKKNLLNEYKCLLEFNFSLRLPLTIYPDGIRGTGELLCQSGEEPEVEIMGRTRGYPGFVSAFQQTAAMLRQAQYDGVCWRHLSSEIGVSGQNLPALDGVLAVILRGRSSRA